MKTTLNNKLNSYYKTILNLLPTDPIYPPVCGQRINKWCCTNNENCSQTNLDKNCCVAPLIDLSHKNNFSVDCKDITNKTIYTTPSLVCTPPLSILTSLIYESANSDYAITNFNYQFQFSVCLINQGGMRYPICTDYYNTLSKKQGGYPIGVEKNFKNVKKIKSLPG